MLDAETCPGLAEYPASGLMGSQTHTNKAVASDTRIKKADHCKHNAAKPCSGDVLGKASSSL